MTVASSLHCAVIVLLTAFSILISIYTTCLILLTLPYFQAQAIYLHSVKLTWFQDTNFPEQWGFLRNQVSPFLLPTVDGEVLHAWHILPIELYRDHQADLHREKSGLVNNITSRLSFKLLRDDPQALLVVYFHGAAGTLGSGYRPPSYRAIYAANPRKIHVVAIDYRGFGNSSGQPSEAGLLTDALTLVKWAQNIAGIPNSRIVVFAQSIGTAVAMFLSLHLAKQSPLSNFAGLILVAPFANVESLTATYRLAGTVPLLSPVARFPVLLRYLNTFIRDKWQSKDKIEELLRLYENVDNLNPPYYINIIHAKDDYDIHWSHSEQLFNHAVRGSSIDHLNNFPIETTKQAAMVQQDEQGWASELHLKNGIVRAEILKYGLHDRIMSYPVVSIAVMNAFENARSTSRSLRRQPDIASADK